MNISCSNNEIDELVDSIPKTKAGAGMHFISAKGGIIYTTCGVICKYNIPSHMHSVSQGCSSSIKSKSYEWYSVSVVGFNYVTITVKPNNSFVSRNATIRGEAPMDIITISQEGLNSTNPTETLVWRDIMHLYKINGPQAISDDTEAIVTFSLSGPYLSSDVVNIYWSVRPHWNSRGGGTVVRGQGTIIVDINFPFDSEVGCTGIVQAQIVPKKKPNEAFIIEHELIMR